MQPRPRAPKRRLILTGAAGFIGSRLATVLCEGGWHVLGLDDFSGGWRERLPDHANFEFRELDSSEPGALQALLAQSRLDGEEPFEKLVHLAARVGVRAVLRDPEGCRTSNLRGVREILRAVEAQPIEHRPRVFAASSSEVYADRAAPLREDDPTRSTEATGRWAYAASKLRGEEILDDAAGLWSKSHGPVHLRFFNVVGPGQDAQSGMVLPTFVERALAGAAIPLHGDGSQVRTFAHVDEVARALAQLLELAELEGGALNVGGTARTSIEGLARCVRTQVQGACEIQSIDPRHCQGANFEELRYREPNLERLRALGVYVPSSSLEEIVADTLEHHLHCARPAPCTTPSVACVSPAS